MLEAHDDNKQSTNNFFVILFKIYSQLKTGQLWLLDQFLMVIFLNYIPPLISFFLAQ